MCRPDNTPSGMRAETLAPITAMPDKTRATTPQDVTCDCRKPNPGLIFRAARELGIDPAASWFIGDTWMDIAAGRAAGCRTVLVGPEHRDRSTHPAGIEPDAAVPDLLAAAYLILAQRLPRRTPALVAR